MIFAYSTNEEEYHELGDFDSYESAFQHAITLGDVSDEREVWIARKELASVDRFVRDIAEDVLEDVAEQAYDEYGEWAEDWPEVPLKAIEKLDLKLRGIVIEFLKEHSPPQFWTVACVKRFDVPANVEQ